MVSMTSIKDMDARHKGMWTYVYRGDRRTTKAVGNVHSKGVSLPRNEQLTPVGRSFHSRQPLGSLQRQPRRSYKRHPDAPIGDSSHPYKKILTRL